MNINSLRRDEEYKKDPKLKTQGSSDTINPYLEISLLFLRREYGITEDAYPKIFIVNADEKDDMKLFINPKLKFEFDNEIDAKKKEEELKKQGLHTNMFQSMAVTKDFKKYLKILQKRKITGDDDEEQDIEKILRKEVKKIEDSISQFTQMGRTDLVEKETSQLEIIRKYIPELMSEEEIKTIINNKITELNITSMNDMGRLMGAVMKETAGRADGNTVKNLVTQILTK